MNSSGSGMAFAKKRVSHSRQRYGRTPIRAANTLSTKPFLRDRLTRELQQTGQTRTWGMGWHLGGDRAGEFYQRSMQSATRIDAGRLSFSSYGKRTLRFLRARIEHEPAAPRTAPYAKIPAPIPRHAMLSQWRSAAWAVQHCFGWLAGFLGSAIYTEMRGNFWLCPLPTGPVGTGVLAIHLE